MEIQVSIPAPVDKAFTYSCDRTVECGVRVLVPFAGRSVVGVCLGTADTPSEPRAFQLKQVKEVLDETPVYSPVMLKLAHWMSQYYCHPLGEVLRVMLPASSSKQVKTTVRLTKRGEALRDVGEGVGSLCLRHIFGKRSSLTLVTVNKKLKSWSASGGGVSQQEYRKSEDLVQAGLVSLVRGSAVKARRLGHGEESDEEAEALAMTSQVEKPPLTSSQQAVYQRLVDEGLLAQSGRKPFLLWGVTGAGKTEVYLNLIETLLDGGSVTFSQALVLVPEISLTPQMTRVFIQRFPEKVAVVHSAMTDKDRWTELERIRQGNARILIGPRSAVFGPFKNLKLIIVDEEHDSSYKQTTGLTYNGRDIAVLRASFEGATVVLGSATPSLESYANALQNKYELLRLPERVSGRPLPHVSVVESKPAYRSGQRIVANAALQKADMPVHPEVMSALSANLTEKHQAMVIVNRRGYAYYLFSITEKKAYACPHCSISMTLHKRSTLLRCHYCDHQQTVSEVIKQSPDSQYVSVGYGSEQAEEFLRQQLPGARIARLDSDVTADRNVLPDTLGKFRKGDIDILVGTQMLAKGHDFPNVTLIALLEVDQQLDMPDFRAGERTFQLIVQAAGRAGRAELPGKVLVQTHRKNHPVISQSIAQDFESFANRELVMRQAHAYPPVGKLALIEFSGTQFEQLNQFCEGVREWLIALSEAHPEATAEMRVLGPSVPGIETIRGRHRRTLLFCAGTTQPIISLVNRMRAVFSKLPGDVRMRVDIDPQSLM